MYRFYAPKQNITKEKITIDDKGQYHHIKNVLRLKVSDEVFIFDNEGNDYVSSIEKITPESIQLRSKAKYASGHLRKTKITLACAIPKKSRMDEIIDKLTQLGVDRIVPLETKRTVVSLDDLNKQARLSRWQRIALSASLQSKRSNVPVIEPITKIEDILSKAQSFDLRLIPTLTGNNKTLKEVFKKNKYLNLIMLIGPEGDFTPSELTLANRSGFVPVTLGNLVLRVETAAIAAVSFIRLYADS